MAGWDFEHCGSGTEEPLEAALAALCRSVENPPAVCFDSLSALTKADAHTNGELVRPESTVVVVIVTDEGDNSRRLTEGEPDPSVYLDAFGAFENRMKFAVIGPDYDAENDKLVCNSGGAPVWAISRLQTMASVTGGFYDPISVLAPDAKDVNDCVPSDFSENLTDLGELLNSLLSSFKLRSIPGRVDDPRLRRRDGDPEVGAPERHARDELGRLRRRLVLRSVRERRHVLGHGDPGLQPGRPHHLPAPRGHAARLPLLI